LQTKMLINNDRYFGDSALLDGMTKSEASGRALDALFHKVVCFGIQEYFEESLVLFSTALGWHTPFYYSSNRKNTRKSLVFEDRHLRLIAGLNAIDTEVYQAALERFLDRISPETLDHGTLKRLRTFNRPMSLVNKAILKLLG
jgi:hypothetical protein